MSFEPILFHYTSWAGLGGILSTGAVWATDILHLNDPTEFWYVIELAEREILRTQSAAEWYGDHDLTTILPHWHPSRRLFVFSLSEEGDLRSQWTDYGRRGRGYAVGFSLDRLQRIVKARKLTLRPVYYEATNSEEVVAQLMAQAIRHVESLPNRYESDIRKPKARLVAQEFFTGVLPHVPFMKDRSFRAEREWRIVAGLGSKPPRIKRRPGKRGDIPYVKLDLRDDYGHLPVAQVVVGHAHKRSRKDAIERLCTAARLEVEVIPSSVLTFAAR